MSGANSPCVMPHRIPLPQRRRSRPAAGRGRSALGAFVGAGLLLPAVLAAAEVPARRFDLPAGDAAQTLKQFAAQAGAQILYSARDVGGVATKPLQGEFPPLMAIERMLEGTALKAREDPATRAIAVTRAAAPPRAPPPAANPPAPPPAPPKTAQPQPDKSPPVKNRTLLALLTNWLAAFSALDAQTAPSPAPGDVVRLSAFEVRTNQDVGYISTNSVGATRINIQSIDLPFSLEVINSELIRDIGSIDVRETLQYTAAVAPNAAGDDEGRIRIRGFATADYKRNGFVLRAQGRPDAAFIDRTEVIRGPGSVLYGIGNPGGSVNIITKQPLGSPRTTLSATVGSNDLYSFQIDAGGPVLRSGQLTYRLVADYRDRGAEAENTFARSKLLGVATRYDFTPRTSLNWDVMLRDEKMRRPTPAPLVPATNNSAVSIVPGLDSSFSALARTNAFVSTYRELTTYATFRHEFSRNLTFRSKTEYVRIPQDRRTREISGNPNLTLRTQTYNDTRNKFTDESVITQNDLAWNWTLANGIKLEGLVGLSFEWNEFNRRRWQNQGSATTIYRPDNSAYVVPANQALVLNFPYADLALAEQRGLFSEPTSWNNPDYANDVSYRLDKSPAGYAVVQASLWRDRLKLLAGGRDERFKEYRESRRSAADFNRGIPGRYDGVTAFKDYQVGATFFPVPGVALYASVSTAHRNNTQIEFIDKPEVGRGFDAGLKVLALENRLSGTLGVFEIEKENIVTTNTATGLAELTGRQKASGFDVSVTYRVFDGLQLRGNYANTKTEILSNTNAPATVGLPIAGMPREVYALWGRYDFRGWLKGLGLAAGYNWIDKRRNGNFDNRFETAYETYGVSLYYGFKVGSMRWNAQLNTNNLGNATYVFGNNFGPGREVRFSLRTTF